MQDYQFNKIQESGDQPLNDDTRILQAEDIDRYHLLKLDITLKLCTGGQLIFVHIDYHMVADRMGLCLNVAKF